jgi:hypothetical protein
MCHRYRYFGQNSLVALGVALGADRRKRHLELRAASAVPTALPPAPIGARPQAPCQSQSSEPRSAPAASSRARRRRPRAARGRLSTPGAWQWGGNPFRGTRGAARAGAYVARPTRKFLALRRGRNPKGPGMAQKGTRKLLIFEPAGGYAPIAAIV